MQPFAFDLLRSQLKFPSSYLIYGFTSAYKGDVGATLCRMFLRYRETQLLHQEKHQKNCRPHE